MLHICCYTYLRLTNLKTQQKANDAFAGYFAKDQFKSFDIQLRDANDKYKATAAVCRE